MKLEILYSHIQKFLISQEIHNVYEIHLSPQPVIRPIDVEPEIRKSRVIFITGLGTGYNNQIDDFFWRNGVTPEIRYHNHLNTLTVPAGYNDVLKLENNFRGRILRWGEDFNWNYNEDQFDSAFLKSFFRLIISKVDNDFFSRHDIAPTFFSPGFSTAGFSDFKGGVEGLIKYINQGRFINKSPADPDFDFIKIFVANGKGAKYHSLIVNGAIELNVNSIFAEIDKQSEDIFIQTFYNSIKNSWKI